jgi:hypothetical protein
MVNRLARAAILAALVVAVAGIGTAAAHEQREVGEYTFTVGMLDEPVFTGLRSGLDLRVARGEEPVEGLEESLDATVTFGSETRDLEISPAFGEPGAYRSVFFPTAAGPYTFHITGDIEGTPVDETFSAGPDTFGEVQDVSAGQFPVQFPATGDVVRDAEAGAGAATSATIALGLGAAGLVAGVVAIGLAVTRRRGP